MTTLLTTTNLPALPFRTRSGLSWPQKTTAITLTLLVDVNVGIAVTVAVAIACHIFDIFILHFCCHLVAFALFLSIFFDFLFVAVTWAIIFSVAYF